MNQLKIYGKVFSRHIRSRVPVPFDENTIEDIKHFASSTVFAGKTSERGNEVQNGNGSKWWKPTTERQRLMIL